MSVAQGYEKVPTNGLVFMYDVADSTSYKGESTTNIAYAVNNNLNSNSNWWVNGGNATFNDNDTSIPKPVIPNVNTSNLFIFSSLVTGTGSNQQLGSSIITISPSTIYSFSIWYYFTGTSMQVYPYVRTAVNNDSLAYFAYNGDTNGANWPKNQWLLLKATVTTQANENGIYMSSYTGTSLNDKVYYFGYQVEQKAHCTPLVLGTRSVTQALLPIAGNSTIDLTNVSFDANAQMTFDGTNDYSEILNFTNKPTASAISCEVIIKPTRPSVGTGTIRGGAISATNSMYIGIIDSVDGGNTCAMHWANQTSNSRLYNWNGQIPNNAYSHLVGTYDGTTTRAYLNGVEIWSAAQTGTIPTATYYIGTYGGTIVDGVHNFNGYIPVAKIYNQALTQEEVQQSYNKYKTRFNLS
jgi:hypothetical protein